MDTEYLNRPAGAVSDGRYDREPLDALKYDLYNRAAVPADHPLRSEIVHYRLGDPCECVRLPAPFPPVDYEGPLTTVGDWLKCAESCKLGDKVEAAPKPETAVEEPEHEAE